ncbi:MAG: Immunoglobulin A1 protease precursor [Firmicutes bacterium ADurb.Bin193]|nr:MAG: Immunoglobulin A1 protease precursor [Firmicutes bacterium ADurb.Bin193]
MDKYLIKILSIILAVMVMITGATFETTFLTASASEGEPDTSWYYDAIALDSSETEFEISTPDQLAGLAQLVNDGTDNFYGKFITLTADIDLSDYGENWSYGKGWMPIGMLGIPFRGFFEGNNHTISGLYISDNNLDLAGLFGYINCGTVKNLRLIDVNVDANSLVGGVAGRVSGADNELSNCYVTGTVNGYESVGGIVGYVTSESSSIINCYTAVNVRGSSYIGGVSGAVTGGNIIVCYATGSVIGSADYVGGITGWLNYGNIGASVVGCVAINLSIKGTSSTTGRIVGINNNDCSLYYNRAFDGMEIMVNDQLKFPLDEGDHNVDGVGISADDILKDINFTLPINHIFEEVTDPFHINPYENDDIYYISTAAQLAYLAYKVNEGSGDYNDKQYKLTSNIDLSAYGKGWNDGRGWIPIGKLDYYFRGKLDGNNHIITGLYINDELLDNVGVFGDVYGGTIKNLGLDEVDITGNHNVGGVAGVINNRGSVMNCYAIGTVKGFFNVGGVIGCVGSGTLANCYFVGAVSLVRGGSIGSTNTAVGGVTGAALGSVENCYAIGTVSGRGSVGGVAGEVLYQDGRLTNCYSICDVYGSGTGIGGVAGVVNGGSVESCVALNQNVKGSDFIGRITGCADDAELFGNHAWGGMVAKIASNKEWIDKTPLDIGNEKADGADLTAQTALTTLFWIDTMGWSEDAWNIVAGKFPVLKNVGGMQRADIINITPDAINNRVIVNLISLWQSDAVVIVAVYSGGKLLNMKFETITQGGDMIVNIAIPTNADMVKATMWDGLATMQPLAPVALSEFIYGGTVRVFVGDTEIQYNTPPIIRDGRIMISARMISEVLDAEVVWDGGVQSLTVKKDDITSVFYPGSQAAYRNGSAVELVVAPIMIDWRVYVSLRDIVKIHGMQMTFSDELQAVIITS